MAAILYFHSHNNSANLPNSLSLTWAWHSSAPACFFCLSFWQYEYQIDSNFYWRWPILKMVLILFLSLNLTEICKKQFQEEKLLIDIFTQKCHIFWKLNLDFWLIFASYCNIFSQICHPNIFNSITIGDNNNLTKILNVGQK